MIFMRRTHSKGSFYFSINFPAGVVYYRNRNPLSPVGGEICIQKLSAIRMVVQVMDSDWYWTVEDRDNSRIANDTSNSKMNVVG